MKHLKINIILLLAIFTSLNSCNNDDDSFTLIAEDVVATIDEHSANGTIIASINTNNANTNNSYTIVSQSQQGGIYVSTIGKIIVADWKLLDYEVLPTYNAIIRVSDGNQTDQIQVTINLNDIDDIEHLLTSSKTNYQNANNGEWVQITIEEYETLHDNLLNVQRHATTKAQYEDFSNTGEFEPGDNGVPGTPCYLEWNFMNDQLPVPANNYVFAFRTYIETVTPETQVWTGYAYSDTTLHQKSILPISGANDFDGCFVYKSSSNALQMQNEAYLCFGVNSSSQWSILSFVYDINGGIRYGANGCGAPASDDFVGTDVGAWFHYQGLSTNIKQW